jgi:SPP1 gp7 family putative phage head morphogenesis protein
MERLSISETENDDLQKAFNKAVRWIFREKKTGIASGDINDSSVQPLLNGINTLLQDGFNRGIEHSVPYVMKRNLSENIYVFSGAKTYAELKKLSGLLLDTDGNIKPFSKFWQDAQSIYPGYNQAYLQAEYIFATQSAQMASKWNDFESGGDRYNLQYRTASDDRVRESHQLLHDTTLPLSDPFWNDYFPPNGWRCRCTAVQVRKSKYPESESTQAQNLGTQATEGRNSIFRFNPGKQQVIFPEHHPYFKHLTPEEKKTLDGIVVQKEESDVMKIFKDTYEEKEDYNYEYSRVIDFQNENGLSDAERIAINMYSISSHKYVNRILRENDITEQGQSFINVLNRGLEKLKPVKTTVFRGANLTKEQLNSYLDAFKNNTPVTETAFTSTSLNKKTAERFGDTIFKIESKNGKNITVLSKYGDAESELLFKPDTKFKITETKDFGGDLLIFMEEI